MYLASLEINAFRGIESLTARFTAGLNVILGENNTGKTAILDAVRLVLGAGAERREMYCTEDDLYRDQAGHRAQRFELHATFKGLSSEEQGGFSACLTPSLGVGVAQVHYVGEVKQLGKRTRFRVRSWGGETEGEGVPPETFDGLRTVYLEALRDPRIGLKPGRNSRISRLLESLSENEHEQAELVAIVAGANSSVEKHDLVKKAVLEINSRLSGIAGKRMAQTADLKLSAPEFRRIAESLRALVGDNVEIDENGLGYNNLLYTATVLGELQKATDADEVDLAALLIEEPEAHLHPHLQTVLIDYLQSVCASKPVATVGNAGEGVGVTPAAIQADQKTCPVQVFVTTHSPTVAARVELVALNVLHIGFDGALSLCAVRSCDLDATEKAGLQRYLDVTKAQLFFARGVIFVEGISEALLMPWLARAMGVDLERNFISVVNVQGLAFRPFAKLFSPEKYRVAASILSDSDQEESPETLDLDEASDTAKTLSAFKNQVITVKLATKTFEYDMALAGNGPRMAAVYEALRPKKGKAMRSAIGSAANLGEQATAFWTHFDAKRDKARFAQLLAASLAEAPNGLAVPAYIREAIEHAVSSQQVKPGGGGGGVSKQQ